MRRRLLFVTLLLPLVVPPGLAAQEAVPGAPPAVTGEAAADSSGTGEVAGRRFYPRRFWPVVGSLVVADVGVMVGLNALWYSDGGQAGFAFYSERLGERYPGLATDGWLDDWHTYRQQDKLGHLFVTWQLTRIVGEYGRWTGLSDGRAALFGATVATLFQSQIEIFDGFAEDYGFSRTDVLANTAGGVLGALQVAFPDRTDWFAAKYSYHPSPYYDHDVSTNPAFSYVGNVLKDYDGISYWLVVRPEALAPAEVATWWPDWLALAVGHSADGLAHPLSGVRGPEHHRQIFLGPDIDLTPYIDRLPRALRPVARAFSFVRLPAPALELGREVRWHWLYY